MKPRKGENDSVRFRSERFFHIDGKYFFATREGDEIGPYSSKPEAKRGLERFIIASNAGHGTNVARSAALGDTWAITNFQ